MNAPDALQLAFGRESFIEAFGAKLTGQISPGFEDGRKYFRRFLVLPTLHQLAISNEIAEDAKERFQCHIPGKHELFIVAPYSVHHLAHRLQIISQQSVGALWAHAETAIEETPASLHDFEKFIEYFGL